MKDLKDLNLLDRFLFAEAMEDPENMRDVLEIILIAPFDLFGLKKYMYTFQMTCKEDSSIVLNDGATRIFLNTHGTNPDEVSPELVELLHYIKNTTQEVADSCISTKIHNMQKRICDIKSSEEVSVRYMQRWEELKMEREEGLAEGAQAAQLAIIERMVDKGYQVELIADLLDKTPEQIQKLLSKS